MKKAAFIISLIAILVLSTFAIAENARIGQIKFDTPIGQSGENPRLILLDNTLYHFSRRDGRILSWKIGEDAMTAFSSLPQIPVESVVMEYKDMGAEKRAEMDRIVTHVLVGDGKLWALNQYSGKFGQINQDGIDYAYTLDLTDLNPELNHDEDYRFPGFVSDGYLYLFSVMRKEMFFARYNLTTGERQNVALEYNLGAVYPDGDGHALCLVNIETEQSNGGYAERIYTLDLVTGEIIPLKIDLPNEADENTTIYIKGVYHVHSGEDLYCFVESGGGASSDNKLLVFDKNGSLKTSIILPQPDNGFYYLCQPIDTRRIIAIDAFGANVLDAN
ncbi:MAG: hypothetical protein RSE58_09835 [Clostridia bacterium]